MENPHQNTDRMLSNEPLMNPIPPAEAGDPPSDELQHAGEPPTHARSKPVLERTIAWLGQLASHRLVPALVLLFAATVIYLPSLGGTFLWDDDYLVYNNPLMRDPAGLLRMWTGNSPAQIDYFPLTSTGFWLQYQLWGNWAPGYRLVNVLLHGLTCILLWRLLRQLALPGAWVAALVFAVHPVHVESVAWISELKNLLTLVLLVPAMTAFVRFQQSGRGRDHAISLGFYLLALCAKSSVVGFPLMLLLFVWWRSGRLPGPRVWLQVLPFAVLAAVFAWVTVLFQHGRAIGVEHIPIGGPLSRVAGAGMAFWFYLSKALLPFDLATIYAKWDYDPAKLWQLALAAAVPACGLVCWFKRHSWGRAVGFGMGCYLLALGPALGLVKMAYMRLTLVADHFQHLALTALVPLVVCGAAHLIRKHRREWLPAAAVVPAWIAGMFMCQSWQHAWCHHNEERLWRASLAQNWKSWQAHNRLGSWLFNQGRPDEATFHFKQGIAADPNNGEVRYNLGVMYLQVGWLDQAAEAFRATIRLKPEMAEGHVNLISTLISDKRADDALAAVEAALARHPDHPLVLSTAGFTYGLVGQFDKAVGPLEKAVSLDPSNPRDLTNLGVVMNQLGSRDEAAGLFQRALIARPGYRPAATNLDHLEHGGELGLTAEP